MDADTGAITKAIEGAEEGLGTNQAKIMEELRRERQRNLASEWQRARARSRTDQKNSVDFCACSACTRAACLAGGGNGQIG